MCTLRAPTAKEITIHIIIYKNVFIMKQKFLLLKLMLLLCMIVGASTASWAADVTDELTASLLGLGGSYSTVTNKTATSSAVYSCNGMLNSNTNIQLRATSPSGIWTTASGGKVKSITVKWATNTTNGRTVDIYGKSSAYEGGADLYNSSNQGTKIGSLSYDGTTAGQTVTLNVTDDYEYIGIRSASGALYINTLTIVWETSGGTTPTTYTVTYDANGGTGTMTDTNSPYSAGATVTVLDNTFTRTDYTFSKWNTAADGSGTEYDEGDTFTINANTTLYAQWTANGGSGTGGSEQWVLTNLADLTSSDVFVIVGNNGSNYAMTNDNGTGSAPAVAAVTVANDAITSAVAANLQWNISGNATDGYTFYPNGSTTTWLYCTNSNNGLRVGGSEGNAFTINNSYLYNTTTSRYIGIYNSSDWRSYTSINNNIKNQTFAFYKKVTSGTVLPSISADNVNITYNAESGNIEYTINNVPDPAGTLSAEVASGATISNFALGTITGSTVPFTCDANTTGSERTATVTLTYTYGNNETVTKNVTVTQAAAPVIYTTIPALFDKATEVGNTATNVNVTFGNWVVSGVNGSNAFVTDNDGNGFIIYTSSHGFAVNDKLSGTVSGTPLKLYNGSAEFTNLTASAEGLNVTNDGVITVITNKTIAELGGVNTGAVITLSNLSYDGTNLTDGTNNIKPYNTLYSDMSLTSGKTYSITGVYQQYGNTKEILPRSAADIVEVVSSEPSITVAAANQNISVPAAGVTDATLDFTYDNLPASPSFSVIFCDAQGADLAAANVPTWISANVTDGTNGKVVTYTVAANENTVERTAYFKIHALDANDDDVYSDLVTVTQAAYIPGDDPIAPATETGCFVKVTDDADLTDGQYLIVYEDGNVAFNGGLDPLDATENGLGVAIYGDKIPATSATVAATFAIWPATGHIKSASGKYIGRITDSNGMNEDTDTQHANAISIDADGNAEIVSSSAHLRYNSASNQLRFRYFKSASYAGQKAIQLYKWDAAATVPDDVTITIKNGFPATTYSSEYALDFSNVTGLNAYVITSAECALSDALTTVLANTGIYVEGTAGTYTVPVIANGNATAVTTNFLLPADNTTPFVNGTNTYYVYGKQDGKCAFYKVPDGGYTFQANNKAVLAVPTPASGAKDFIEVNGGATSISTIDNSQFTIDSCYDLSGRRVAQPTQKGIYIVNGKKIVIK